MGFVIEAPEVMSLPVAGSEDRFPIRRIYCVGRNYAAHAREMGKDPDREPPFFFSKPASAVVLSGGEIPYPSATADLHFEGELVVALGQGGSDIQEAEALDHVLGYAAGNDLTRRDMQAEAKKMGRPWDMAKGFDCSAIVGTLHPVAEVGHLSEGDILTLVNGEIRQKADLMDMIWSVPETISYLSGLVALEPGDLIMTGTPAGVGAFGHGDVCEVKIAGLSPATVAIQSR